MRKGILILTQDHNAIYTAQNIRLNDCGESSTYDLYADIVANGVKAYMRVAKYRTRQKAQKVLEAIAQERTDKVFDLRV